MPESVAEQMSLNFEQLERAILCVMEGQRVVCLPVHGPDPSTQVRFEVQGKCAMGTT